MLEGRVPNDLHGTYSGPNASERLMGRRGSSYGNSAFRIVDRDGTDCGSGIRQYDGTRQGILGQGNVACFRHNIQWAVFRLFIVSGDIIADGAKRQQDHSGENALQDDD